MKKLSLESFFHPEIPSSANKHKFPNKIKKYGNTFPYILDDKESEKMTDDEISQEIGLSEFKLGRTMPNADNLSKGGKMNNSAGIGGKASKSFANYMQDKETDKVPEDVHALNIDYTNFDPQDEYEGVETYIANESLSLTEMVRGAREMATKEMAPVSTKQPWANGLPSHGNDYSITQDEEYENLKSLEKEVGLSLESILREFADTDWERGAQSKKAFGEDEDIDFFENLEGDGHQFLMNSETEFRDTERKRKNEKK